MQKLISDHPVTISVVTGVTVILSLLAFGVNLGGFKEEFKQTTSTVQAHSIEIKKLPVIEEKIRTIDKNVQALFNKEFNPK